MSQIIDTFRGANGRFLSSTDAFKKTHGNITIILDPNRTDCLTEVGGKITCGPEAMTLGTFIHEYFHVFDNQSHLYASNHFPPEWLDDPDYQTGAYKCDKIVCIAHPPSLGGYDSFEAFANAGQNMIMGALNISPATNGFDYSEGFNQAAYDIQLWFDRTVEQALKGML